MKKIFFIVFSVIFLFDVLAVYANGSADENPNEISDYFKNQIAIGKIKPLNLLQINDKEKYEIIINIAGLLEM